MGRRVVAIVIALVVAIVGAGAVVAYASSADQRAVAGQEVRTVFIATKAVPKGTSAEDAAAKHLIRPSKVVAKGVPTGALTDPRAESADGVALATIPAGSIVLASAFGELPKTAQAKPAVPKGKVALTVDLPAPARVASMLQPGTHVVIYDTYVARDPDADPLTADGQHLPDKHENVRNTIVLLPDVEVIALGTEGVGGKSTVPTPKPSDAEGESQEAPPVDDAVKTLVTVAVTPAEATKLVHGIQTGTLYAGLRGDDVKVDTSKDFSDNDVHRSGD